MMITIALFDDLMNLFKSNYYYTTVLFSGTKNYSTLKVAANAFIQELQELSNTGMVINNILWNFELFLAQIGSFLPSVWILMLQTPIISAHGVKYLKTNVKTGKLNG